MQKASSCLGTHANALLLLIISASQGLGSSLTTAHGEQKGVSGPDSFFLPPFLLPREFYAYSPHRECIWADGEAGQDSHLPIR